MKPPESLRAKFKGVPYFFSKQLTHTHMHKYIYISIYTHIYIYTTVISYLIETTIFWKSIEHFLYYFDYWSPDVFQIVQSNITFLKVCMLHDEEILNCYWLTNTDRYFTRWSRQTRASCFTTWRHPPSILHPHPPSSSRL